MQIANYTMERELGRGGMGAVYLGVHALLGRRAAIKVLLPELSRNQEMVQRFFNEARAATAIQHAGIVEIYDFGFAPDGSGYIVMEHLSGEPLATRLTRQGRLSPAQALPIARQIATTLAAAHAVGIVHRDLKPDNVFLVRDDEIVGGERVKLLDFGIAKLTATDAAMRTQAGAVMGTPTYMAPEQCRSADQVDHRSDLYALGCMLFEMVCGRPPFPGNAVLEVLTAQLQTPPPAPRTLVPDVPRELEQLILRLLAKAPADRPDSAEAVAASLVQIAGQLGVRVSMSRAGDPRPPAPRRRRGAWIAAAGLGAAAAIAGVVLVIASGSDKAPAAAVPPGIAPTPSAVSEAARLSRLGQKEIAADRLASAERAFRDAITLDPQAKYYRNLLVALFHQGKYGEAMTAHDLALASNPTPELVQQLSGLRAAILKEVERQMGKEAAQTLADLSKVPLAERTVATPSP